MKKLTAFLTMLVLVLVCSAALAAQVDRYVNTESTPGGDGTTPAITGVHRAYASLSEWNAAEATDLVAAGDTHVVHCDADDGAGSHSADATAVIISGWTTDATHDITIQVDADKRHNGKWDTSAYRLDVNGRPLVIDNSYVKFYGLQVRYAGTSDMATIHFEANGGIGAEVAYCIVRGNPAASAYTAMAIQMDNPSVAGIAKIYNNIIYDSYIGIITYYATNLTAYVYNNTVTNMVSRCIESDGKQLIAINNITQNCGTNCFQDIFPAASDYNISDDGTAPGSHSKTMTSVVFVDDTTSPYDFHLAPTDTAAKDSGTDLSSDPNLSFSDDVDGETRTAPWDIGADEYVSAVTSNLKKIGDTDLTDVGSIGDTSKSGISKIGDEGI